MPEHDAGQAQSPSVWCPWLSQERLKKGAEQREKDGDDVEGKEEQKRRELEQQHHEERETPDKQPTSRRLDIVQEQVGEDVVDDKNGAAAVGGNANESEASSPTGRNRRDIEASVSRAALALEAAAEQTQTGPERALRLAWIPADPCSCVDAPGIVGEASRGWL